VVLFSFGIEAWGYSGELPSQTIKSSLNRRFSKGTNPITQIRFPNVLESPKDDTNDYPFFGVACPGMLALAMDS